MSEHSNESNPGRSVAEIQTWLVKYLAEELNIAESGVDVDITLDRLGVSSLNAVVMSGAMESWLGKSVDPTAPYDHPTISKLAIFLADSETAGESA